jgi:hypothetical protein
MSGDDDGGILRPIASPWPPVFSPLGSQVSDRLLIDPDGEYDVVRHAVASIDMVHGDGLLRRVRAQLGHSRAEAASYEWNSRTGQPLRLTFSRRAPRPELSIVHEIGHFLDQEALGYSGQLGSETGVIPAIMDAINASEPFQWLTALAGRKQIRLRLPNRRRPQVLPIDASVVQYLREPGELFARAYAQLIATASQDQRLLAQLNEVLADPFLGGVYHIQWPDHDFMPIARAFEQEWRGRQWIE